MRQFTFTSYDDEATHRGGWQVKNAQGFTAEELAVETGFLSTGARLIPHLELPFVVPAAERDRLPTRLCLTRASPPTTSDGANDDGDGAPSGNDGANPTLWVRLSQERPAGMDGSGRPHNSFTHTVVAPHTRFAALGLPIRAYGAPGWLSPYGAAEVNASTLPTTSVLEPEFLDYDWAEAVASDATVYARLLNTLHASMAARWAGDLTERPLIVLRSTDPARGVQWIEALSSACVPADAWQLCFSTYERRVDASRAQQLLRSGFDLVYTPDMDQPAHPHAVVVTLTAEGAVLEPGSAAVVELDPTGTGWGDLTAQLVGPSPTVPEILQKLGTLESLQHADAEATEHPEWGVAVQLMRHTPNTDAAVRRRLVTTILQGQSTAGQMPADSAVHDAVQDAVYAVVNDPDTPPAQAWAIVVADSVCQSQQSQLMEMFLQKILHQPQKLAALSPFAQMPALPTGTGTGSGGAGIGTGPAGGVRRPRLNVMAAVEKSGEPLNPIYLTDLLLLLQQLHLVDDPDTAGQLNFVVSLWASAVVGGGTTLQHPHHLLARLDQLTPELTQRLGTSLGEQLTATPTTPEHPALPAAPTMITLLRRFAAEPAVALHLARLALLHGDAAQVPADQVATHLRALLADPDMRATQWAPVIAQLAHHPRWEAHTALREAAAEHKILHLPLMQVLLSRPGHEPLGPATVHEVARYHYADPADAQQPRPIQFSALTVDPTTGNTANTAADLTDYVHGVSALLNEPTLPLCEYRQGQAFAAAWRVQLRPATTTATATGTSGVDRTLLQLGSLYPGTAENTAPASAPASATAQFDDGAASVMADPDIFGALLCTLVVVFAQKIAEKQPDVFSLDIQSALTHALTPAENTLFTASLPVWRRILAPAGWDPRDYKKFRKTAERYLKERRLSELIGLIFPKLFPASASTALPRGLFGRERRTEGDM